MQSEEQEEDNVLLRAKKAMDENDMDYARFLYEEALAIDPQNNAARAELHKLRESMPDGNSLLNRIKFAYYATKVFFHKMLSKHSSVINDAENLLSVSRTSYFALRAIMRAAYNAGYYKLVIFVAEKEKDQFFDTGDMLILAKSYLNEKTFDKATKIAKEVSELDPENEEAKDILWKSSVEKHMNSDVQLVTAGGDRRFVPPKIDREKIFIASHKDEKKDEKPGKK